MKNYLKLKCSCGVIPRQVSNTRPLPNWLKFFHIFVTQKYDSKKIFSSPDSVEYFWAPFQLTMKISFKTKLLSPKFLIFSYSCFKFGQKNIQKYIFDVKFFAEHDPGIRKNKKSRGKPENWKKGKNCKIAVAKEPSTFKISK